MTMPANLYNINPRRRADYILDLQFKDNSNVPIILTGWTVYAQVWNKTRTTKYVDFAVTYTNPANGEILISLTDAQTVSLPDECFYDVMLEDLSGFREYYLAGIVYVSEGYSAP